MTTVRLLKNGVEAFPAMFEAVDRAATSVILEMYIIAGDGTGRELRRHLTRAAQRGALVKVLVDAWGTWELPSSFWDELTAAGGIVRSFHPIAKGLFPFRNHRKMLLVDDAVAYIGGMNIADEYYRGAKGQAPWRDNMLEISGPAVAPLRGSFHRIWSKAEGPLRRHFLRNRRPYRETTSITTDNIRFLESGPDDPLRPVRRIYALVINSAAVSIDLAMGYFYPHGKILRALRRAVKRGVRVRLLFPQKTDVPAARWAARGLYGRLLRSGVEVWEYLPAMMHAKLAVADDTVIAGSANLDIRSGMINYELVAVVNDAALAGRVREDFEDDLAQSQRIQLEEWNKRSLVQRFKERFSYCLLARADILFSRSGFARRMR
jgi:cardiolipin synthase